MKIFALVEYHRNTFFLEKMVSSYFMFLNSLILTTVFTAIGITSTLFHSYWDVRLELIFSNIPMD